ncbi:MAG: ATP-binding cassette domain-containing protein [Thermotogae bacterium]|nr:ATP-binding cassette domain-containing protein [Thermotogota bacterium]
MLKIRGLYKTYGRKPVLRGLDMDVEEGERVFLLAPNGYGKSTLLKVIANVEPFQAGEISVMGRRVPSAASRSVISYVSENDNLYEGFSVGYIASFSSRFWRMDMEYLWEFLGISGIPRTRKYGELSKGQRMLVRVALGMAKDVPMYLVDEPLSALDFVLREKVLRMLERRRDRTFLFTSHQIDELANFATRFVFLKDGRITLGTSRRETLKDMYREVFGG